MGILDSMDDLDFGIAYGHTDSWAERDKYDVKHATEGRDPVRLGVVGLGGIALGKHLPAIARLRERGVAVEVVGGAEIDAGLREKVSAIHGFPCYASAAEMLDAQRPDGILALTDPGESRREVMALAIDRGIHLFTEKPFLFLGVDRLAESIDIARDLVAQARARKLVVMTGLVKQFSPPYRIAGAIIERGLLGPLSMISVKMCQGWSRHILLEGQACHVLHVTRRLGGEIKGLTAFGINRYDEPAYPHDNITVNVEFESGAIGAFCFNSSSPSLKPWERIEVFGQRKWLAVEDAATVTLHDSETAPSKVWAPVVPHTLLFDEEFGGFVDELHNFVRAIRGDEAPAVTGEDGIAALELAHMIHLAIRERRYVARAEIAATGERAAA